MRPSKNGVTNLTPFAIDMTLDEYKAQYGDSDDAAPGWDAIDSALEKVYAGQTPLHWGTAIPYVLGGADPLDGISAYESDRGGVHHLHFVTYGYSSLYYDEESVGSDYSNFGFEMTFRLACPRPTPPEHEFNWVCNFRESIFFDVPPRMKRSGGAIFANFRPIAESFNFHQVPR